MVRYCIVPSCANTDLTILSHRFPRKPELLKKWSESLDVHGHSAETLFKSFVVCTLHFEAYDYRNPISNFLNVTAVPKLNPEKPRATKGEKQLLQNNLNQLSDNVDPTTEIEDCQENEFQKVNMTKTADTIPNYVIQRIGDDVELIQDSLKAKETDGESLEKFMFENIENSEVEIFEYEVLSDSNSNYESSKSISLDDENITCNENYKNSIEVSCQVNASDLEICDNEDENFMQFTRSELISQIKSSQTKIEELEMKLKCFQNAHLKFVQSLEDCV